MTLRAILRDSILTRVSNNRPFKGSKIGQMLAGEQYEIQYVFQGPVWGVVKDDVLQDASASAI